MSTTKVTDALRNVTAVDAAKLTGSVDVARLPSTVVNSNVDLTTLSASNLTSGTVADARFPATLPATSGVNLTALNGSNIGSGTVPTARLGTGTASSSTFLRGDSTYAAPAASGADYFWAKLSSNQTIATGTWAKLTLTSEQWDNASLFDASTNYRIVIPSGEYWVLGMGWYLEPMNDNGLIMASIKKNTSDHYQNNVEYSGSGEPNGSFHFPVVGNGSDYFEAHIWHNYGSNRTLYKNIPTGFWGWKIA